MSLPSCWPAHYETLQRGGAPSAPCQCPASKVTLIFLPAGHLSQFSASFPRASRLSASTGPPGPSTTWCLSTVSTRPALGSLIHDDPGGSAVRAGVSVCATPVTSFWHQWDTQQQWLTLASSAEAGLADEPAHPETPHTQLSYYFLLQMSE